MLKASYKFQLNLFLPTERIEEKGGRKAGNFSLFNSKKSISVSYLLDVVVKWKNLDFKTDHGTR